MESGYDIGQIFNMNPFADFGKFFEGLPPGNGGINAFMPMAIPVVKANTFLPFTIRPHTGVAGQTDSRSCGCGAGSKIAAEIEVDEEMRMRRDLNAQMRAAVEKEEFELAAELRDKIKELEAKSASRDSDTTETNSTLGTGRRMKCDSETTSQDSPAAQ